MGNIDRTYQNDPPLGKDLWWVVRTPTRFVGGMGFHPSRARVGPAGRDDGDNMVWYCESVNVQT